MGFLRFVIAPFVRMFRAIRLVNQRVYCGDSTQCVGLSYSKGNLNQAIPVPVSTWNSCPLPGPAERPKH